MVNALAGRAGKIGGFATLLKVFLPYLVWNTVFDNSRVVAEMGRKPVPFSEYCFPLLKYSRETHFVYKYRDWPSGSAAGAAARGPGRATMMDFVLEAWVSSLIELNKLEWVLGAGQPWKSGTKLKLLFAGYNGTRNTGSDVRVEEMLRQVRRILGPQNLELSVMTQNFDLTRGYFGDAKQVHLPDVFPPFLHSEVRKNDGVVACEGSMFKSKFANALTTMMIGSLGIASAQNKLSVAYRRRSRPNGPAAAENVQALLQRFAGDYAQRRIARGARQAGRPNGIGHGYGMDF